jgi:hypothetical protein
MGITPYRAGHAEPRCRVLPGIHKSTRHPDLIPEAVVVPEPLPIQPSTKPRSVSRRSLLTTSAALAGGLASFPLLERLSSVPQRMALSADAVPNVPSDIQFDIGAFIPPAQTINGIPVRFGPVHTLFATANLDFLPSVADQTRLENALLTIESVYPWSPSGVFTQVAYGGPYWNAFPQSLSTSAIPQLTDGTGRFVQAPAVPGPTDVHPNNPGITKDRFNVRVQLETNVVLFTIRSDVLAHTTDVANWLAGSNRLNGQAIASPRFGVRLTFTSFRAMFTQIGLPRQVANQAGFSFASVVNPNSSMWMSFVDQQVNASAAASRVTFAGSGLTDGTSGRYLDLGAIQHLSHVIQDLHQFYDVDEALGGNGQPVFGDDSQFAEKVQYMFHAPPIASSDPGNILTGPAVLPNQFRGTGYAAQTAQGIGTDTDSETGQPERRVGHLSALQRSSRDAQGGPLHQRLDGPGFDSFDMNQPGVPSRFVNKSHPKLQFSVFVPSSAFFETMRRNQASLDLQQRFGSNPDDNGLERFITATRRQNFLVPPRRHRSFPLVEFL